MICCTGCFKDLEIKAAIESLNHIGKCPICGTEKTWIYDSEVDLGNSDFEELLISIIEIYIPESELNENFPDSGKNYIECHLDEEWDIFKINPEGIRLIIENLVITSMDLDNQLLRQKVGIPDLYNEMYLEQNSILGKYEWDDFKTHLRNSNRFHSRYMNLHILADVLADTVSTIASGTKFYRARIAKDEDGIKRGEMGAPPDDIASAGRANSKGISCLYLANKRKTTVKEIRANAFDYVTIATFKLNRDVKVIDLSIITHNSPFYADTNKVKFLINEKHLRRIESDLAKPVSSRDSDLDYLPTQYISDFAKYLGYDGVKYVSTFDKTSYNIALFDTSNCTCTYSRNYLIGNLDYKLNAL